MALTLDGIVPNMGMSGSSSSGIGMGALGGGVAGLLLGGLLSNNGNGGLFGNGNNNNNGAATTAVTTDIVLNPAFQSLQNQITGLSTTLNTGEIQDSISRLGDGIANIATAQASANFTTLNSINGLSRDLVTNIHQQDLTQMNSFNTLTTTTLQGFNGLAMQNQNSANQIIAQGTANAMAMANCCCEIKSTILADGNATRALINDTNMQALRDQLAAANSKVSNNDQSQYLLTTILQHLSPASRTVVV
jgi:hypothetical protein